jgi:hypothetical protein
MKFLKWFLILIVSVVALVLIIGLFVDGHHNIVREVTINKPKKQVFDYIKYIKNQDNYSVWNQKDPNMQKDYKGTDGTVGFVYSWNSKNSEVGVGEQEISKISDGERIDMLLRFRKPMNIRDTAYMKTEAVDSATTKVKWGFVCDMPYPWKTICLFMNMDKMIGNDLSSNLTNLKTLLEKK